MKKIIASLLVFLSTLAPLAQASDVETLSNAVEESTLLLQLKQKLASAQYRYYLLTNNIEVAESGVHETEEVIEELEVLLEGMDEQIVQTDKKIRSVNRQIEEKKMAIGGLEENIQILNLEMEDQKAVVAELMRLLYVKRGIYFEDADVNPVKLLASEGTVSESLQELSYLDWIEEENKLQIERLAEMDEQFKNDWKELRLKREELSVLDDELQGEYNNLLAQREGKQRLLDETLGEQAIYETMLEAAGEREEELEREMEIYAQNVAQMEAKLEGTRVLLSEEQREIISEIEADAQSDFGVESAASAVDLDWPVDPSRGLTAYFHDSGYVERFGVNHRALDVRANHGTPVMAPADGMVYKVVYDSDSTNYAYIMLAHRKGTMTVYGHMSEVAVSAGDYVNRGQIIGLSGGTPGTVGAGVRTTGPHLHFEVWQDGVRVDPLLYLPVEEAPLNDLPEPFFSQVKGQLEEQIRQLESALGR